MSGDNPEWFYCFLCHKEMDEEDAVFVEDEARQAHEKCLDKGGVSE